MGVSSVVYPPTWNGTGAHHHHHLQHILTQSTNENGKETQNAPGKGLGNNAVHHHRKTGGRHIKFTLPREIYSWLESMALVHNYGSVHKSIRDLLCWACTGQEEDYEWLFSTPHLVTYPILSTSSSCIHSSDESNIAHKQTCTCMRQNNFISLEARVSDDLFHWISTVVETYSLSRGPSTVLEIICTCAIELSAANDIFESNECGHDLAETTAELYHDLGLIRFHVATRHHHHQHDGDSNSSDGADNAEHDNSSGSEHDHSSN